jgi:hypothetical protein
MAAGSPACLKPEVRKMDKLIKTALSVSLIFAFSSGVACEYPERILIPNGNTATKEEMLAGQSGVKNYVAAMETYLECIVEEEKMAREEMDDLEPEDEQEREDALNKKHDAAVDEMERVAAQFNAEVQAYRAQSSN